MHLATVILCTFLLATVLITDVSNGQFANDQSVQCDRNSYQAKALQTVKSWTVNLDERPFDRWKQMSIYYSKQIKAMAERMKEFLYKYNVFGHLFVDVVERELKNLVKLLPREYAEEIRGISHYSGLTLSETFLYNIFYEMCTLCVSIVAETPSGNIYHGRNLDFGLHRQKNRTTSITYSMRPLVINVDFLKKGKTLFKSVHFAGYIGVTTAVRPGAFSVSLNARDGNNSTVFGILEWLLGKRTGKWTGFWSRDTMTQAQNYSHAKQMLSNVELLAPAYFIIGGIKHGEGCVITRQRRATIDVWDMKQAGGWYILETNYDHWKSTLDYDKRRKVASMCMKKLTEKGVCLSGVFNVLSTQPVCDEITTYTAVMEVSTGHLETRTQYCN